MKIKTIIFLLLGLMSALASIFFFYYTVRLIYVNLAIAETVAHRSGGMLIGAVVFPVAIIVFGILSWLCFKRARGVKQK
ncbi:MAG: hypothetical protein ABJA66_12970 [Actinomycetota bacterium]